MTTAPHPIILFNGTERERRRYVTANHLINQRVLNAQIPQVVYGWAAPINIVHGSEPAHQMTPAALDNLEKARLTNRMMAAAAEKAGS